MIITLETRFNNEFPLLSSQFIVTDTEQIDPYVAQLLESNVHNSRFFERLTRINLALPSSGAYLSYSLRIQENQNIHTLQFSDPIQDNHLKNIVLLLNLMARSSPILID